MVKAGAMGNLIKYEIESFDRVDSEEPNLATGGTLEEERNKSWMEGDEDKATVKALQFRYAAGKN